VVQGEFAVSDDPRQVFTTLLGSCVAACIMDTEAGVGGINHFLLPGDDDSNGLRYGVNAMELLINGLLQRGARRDRLRGKLFGGARVLDGFSDIGRQNAAFAERFFRDESVAYLGGSLGGSQARRIQFWPTTGRARQRFLTDDRTIFEREVPAARPAPAPSTGAVELF
jgi:chemotaxis protein CheD